MTKQKNNIFDEFKLIFESEDDFKISSQFMINRLMSFTEEGFEASIYANDFIGKVEDSLLLSFYRSKIQVKNAPYISYVKKPKLIEPKLLNKICKYFCCRELHARQIIDIYRNKGIDPESLFGLKKGE